jgi:probable rRNA maturation factor
MITVQVAQHFLDVPVDAVGLEKLARCVCERLGAARAVVSIGIVDDAEISRLNETYLGRRGTTDCLSFDLSDSEDAGGDRVFEVIVNGELALREAAARGHAAEAELALYIAHGLLHNLGFDDATPGKAREMHRMENEILEHLGYGLLYDNDEPAA